MKLINLKNKSNNGIDIINLKKGKGSPIIFINGFLSQEKQNFSDWLSPVSEIYPDNPMYGVLWKAESLGRLTGLALYEISELIKKKKEKASNRSSIVRFIISELLSNPWHTTMLKASETGKLLANLLIENNSKYKFILMGHSLGARIIYYTLETLALKEKTVIKDVYLLGGAAGNQCSDWKKALKAVDGTVYNIYSKNDKILRRLYRYANLRISTPIGIKEIKLNSVKLVNIDVSSFVKGHMEYKKYLEKIFTYIKKN